MRTRDRLSEPSDATLMIRIPKSFKKKIKMAAAEDDRSLTSYVVHALKAQMARGKIRG